MTTTRYVIIQAGLVDMSRLYRTPEAAQRAADRINATLERELGEECWGDGAASVMDIALPQAKLVDRGRRP